jgi:hypothetical protein
MDGEAIFVITSLLNNLLWTKEINGKCWHIKAVVNMKNNFIASIAENIPANSTFSSNLQTTMNIRQGRRRGRRKNQKVTLIIAYATGGASINAYSRTSRRTTHQTR